MKNKKHLAWEIFIDEMKRFENKNKTEPISNLMKVLSVALFKRTAICYALYVGL